MSILPFDQPGKFWRGNLHTHSTVSDGTQTPEEVCRLYQDAGYDFLSLTEHWMEMYGRPILDTRKWRTDDFTTLIGAELHGPQTEMGNVWHLVANGLPLDFQAEPDSTGPALAQMAMDAGAFVAVAHPQWYTLTETDIQSLASFDAIEVFNGVAVDHNDRPESWHIADIFLSRGLRTNITAADDFHGFSNSWDFERGWVWVKSEELSPQALLASLKAGRYYSSTGPMIHEVTLSAAGKVTVSCSPAERVLVSGKGPAVVAAGGRGLREVEIDLAKFDSPYARVTVRDAYGRHAWTNPFWFDEL
jgi:hypothetical protein